MAAKVGRGKAEVPKGGLATAGGGESSDSSELVFAKAADHTTLNLDVIGRHHDRSHFGICRLEPYLAGAFAIKALESRFFAADQRHNDVTGIGDLGLFAHYEIPIHNVIFNHRSAFDLQDKGITTAREIAQRNRFAFFHGFQRTPRGDPTHQRKLLHLAIGYLLLDRLRQLDDLDGTALIVTAADKTLFLERGDVLVHGGQGRELEALADFLEARRVAVLGLKRNEVVENFFLTFGESHVRLRLRIFATGTLGEKKANVKKIGRAHV